MEQKIQYTIKSKKFCTVFDQFTRYYIDNQLKYANAINVLINFNY